MRELGFKLRSVSDLSLHQHCLHLPGKVDAWSCSAKEKAGSNSVCRVSSTVLLLSQLQLELDPSDNAL